MKTPRLLQLFLLASLAAVAEVDLVYSFRTDSQPLPLRAPYDPWPL